MTGPREQHPPTGRGQLGWGQVDRLPGPALPFTGGGILAGGITSPSCSFLSGAGSDTIYSRGPRASPPAIPSDHTQPACWKVPAPLRKQRERRPPASSGEASAGSAGLPSISLPLSFPLPRISYYFSYLSLSLSFLPTPSLPSFTSGKGPASRGPAQQRGHLCFSGRAEDSVRLAWLPTFQPQLSN